MKATREIFFLSFFALLSLSCLPAFAQKKGGVSLVQKPAAKFVFAVPSFDSEISIGIYNDRGILIRKLAEMLPEKSFAQGLDGFIAEWDGKNDAGQEAEPGVYSAVGFAVGNLPVEGIAFSGNGWIEELGGLLPVVKVRGVATGASDTLVILADIAGGETVLFGWNPVKSALLWKTKLQEVNGDAPCSLARNATEWAVVARGGKAEVFDPATGTPRSQFDLPPFSKWIGVAGGTLLVSGEKESAAFSLPEGKPVDAEGVLPLPAGVRSFSQKGETRFVCDDAGAIWVGGKEGWKAFPRAEGVKFGDVLAAGDGGFWALVAEEGEARYRMGEFSAEGEYLRQIDPQTFRGTPEKIAGDSESASLFVSCGLDGGGEELLGIRKAEGSAEGTWEIFFKKAIDPEGQLPPSGFRPLPARMKLEVAGAMSLGRESTIFRIAVNPPGTICLETPEGLKLADLFEFSKVTGAWIGLEPGNNDALRFWVKTPGAVEECRVVGLHQIARLEIGTLAWPPRKK